MTQIPAKGKSAARRETEKRLFESEAALQKAFEEIKRSESKLRQVIDTIPTLAWCNLPDGPNEFLSKRWHEYTGLSPEESHGWGWQAVFHPEDLHFLMKRWREMLVSGEPDEIEARIRRHDGVYRWFLIRAAPLRDETGKVVRWYGTSTDIEDRKRAEDALRASEFTARMIVDGIPGLVARIAPTGEVEVVNRPLLEYFGKDLEGIRNWANTGAIHPDDLPAAIETFNTALPAGRPFDVEQRLRRFDGVYRWFQSRGLPLRDPEGRILHWYVLLTDIEERKLVEEKLRRSEALLVEGQHLSRTGTFSWSVETGEIRWSEELYRIFDFAPNLTVTVELIGSRVHPDDLPMLGEMIDCARRGDDHFEYEHRIVMPGGSTKCIHLIGHAVRDAGGHVEYFGAAHDITQRRIAEKAFEASERNLTAIINTIPTLAWSARPDGSAEFLNQHYLDYIGLPLEKLQGWGWTVAVHPEDLNALSSAWQSIMAAGKPGEAEARLRRFDGAYRWFLFRTNPMLGESGEIVKWYGTNTDIDDRKRAEAEVKESYLRLAEAQQLSKTGSFITDLVADDHNWSEETFRILEFDPGTKISVQMIRNMIHPEDLPSFDSMIARAMTGKDVDFSFRFVTSRGAVKHIRGMARVIQHVVGRPLFIGALQDVTDSKAAEEALNRARSELAHVSRVTTLNALTASIAHEINQPLSGIITNANTCLLMLSDDPPDVEGARETTRRTIRDGNRASDVINRLRALYSKKDSRPELMDLNEATREVISLSLSDLQRNRVILLPELADDLPRVAGDRIQLQQVILNLLRNASDAMKTVDDRPRELVIKTEREEGNQVRLSVKDVGIGLKPLAADKLFEAFYTTKDDGMGIGLHVSRSIIEAHRGRLWAAANEGYGATFCFAIPSMPGDLAGADSRDAGPHTLASAS